MPDSSVKDAFIQVMERIYASQNQAMERAARMAAQSISEGGTFFVYDRGHVIGRELVCRSGGPVFVRAFDYRPPEALMTSPESLGPDSHPRGDAAENADFEPLYVRHFMVQNGFRKGDVLLMNSVSGRAQIANYIAECARDMGLKIIAIASLDTIGKVRKGLKPYIEYADVVIDNCVAYGDSLFEADGIDERLVPPSGIAAAYIGWTLLKEICELLAAMGKAPSVFRSVNIAGGEEQNKACIARYQRLGY